MNNGGLNQIIYLLIALIVIFALLHFLAHVA